MAEFPIVGIGSSAGGVEALQKLFGAMPSDSGLGFVIAAHLDPTRESHLAELLGRCTRMPVMEIGDQVAVEPDHVYVIAPDRELRIKGGVLYSERPQAPRGHRHPVDSFFRSLAEDLGERAIAIVLSGTGTNGSLGLRFIKAEGGIALAQEPATAAFQGMPRSAIGTGIVDLVLAPEKMPEALLGLASHAYVRQPAKVVEAAPEDQLNTLLALLYAQGGRDFKGYKRGTLLRRIHRRMGLHRINDLQHYIERLRTDGNEVKALVGDLTINVTGFFRDPEAWETLAQTVIAPLLKEREAHATVRVWVPGCSTGEEVYSIAILITEQAEALGKSFDVRMFATDVAEGVLSSARAGLYPASVAMDVGERRLQRFFEQQDDTYCIRKSIRDAVTFAPQNLLQDPPFSRLDLISCRNLLIYLEPEMQKRVLGLFHFALREGGHLFLGSAETISGQEELFETVSKKWRIFRRVGPTRHDVVDFSALGGGLPTGLDRLPPNLPGPPVEPHVRAGELMMQALADRFAPASALIDAQHRVHYLRGPTGEYLQPASGEPSHNLIAMARDGLQTPLRQAVRKALAANQEIATEARVRRDGAQHPVRLIVTPLKPGRDDGAQRLLVSFLDGDRPAGATTGPTEALGPPDEGPSQAELDTAREDLRLTIEQMEASNEELKSSNEETYSINEELQATNEELETSKEELQSLNEELNTVNNQLQAKLGELEERTDDLNNLLNSTDIATLFLDRSLCIRWFTPAMKALFELLPSDIGRPIAHFAQRFEGSDLVKDAKRVLAKLAPMDSEVVSDAGRWYIRHMLPYRTGDDRILGVAVTFTDITERKRSEEALHREKERAQVTLRSIDDAVITTTKDTAVDFLNPTAEVLTGWPSNEASGKPLDVVFTVADETTDASVENPIAQCLRERRPVEPRNQLVLVSRNGRKVAIQSSAAPIRNEQKRIIGAVLIFRDATEARKLAREATYQANHDPLTGLLNRRELERHLAHSLASAKNQSAHHVLCFIDLDGFKLINDTAGHAAGDELLKQIAQLMTRNCRSRDSLARIGGDEFCLLMEHCSLEQATTVAASIIAAIRTHEFAWDDTVLKVGCSIGLAKIDAASMTPRQSIADADLACYSAKARGGNRVYACQESERAIRDHSSTRVQVGSIHRAVNHNHFRLLCQPIHPILKTNAKTGMHEVLLRLVEKDGELISANDFVTTAERYGVMPAIDRWVISTALRMLCTFIMRNKSRMLAVNLSGHTINDDKFLEFMISDLAESNFPANQLCLEITETAAIHNFSQVAALIDTLRHLGCRFALDDFGKGVSSLTYLKNFSVDYLKIDGSFVLNMVNSKTDRAMVSAVNQMAHALGMETIAECVETSAALKELTALGADYVQGFAVGQPLPIETLMLND